MAAAYASLVSLMHTIQAIQHHLSPPISLDKQLLDSIAQRIAFFQQFLHDYNSPPPVADDDEEAPDPLEMRIAGAAHAAEDAIESHVVEAIQHQGSNNNNANDEKIKSMTNLCRGVLQSVIEDMDSIKKVVVVKVDTNEKKALQVVHDQDGMTSTLASVAHNETLAGSDAVLNEIMGDQLDRQVIPIVGMGGIGKTFLATSIYSRRNVKDRFDICAWATISQDYNTGKIIRELLSQLLSSGATSKEEVTEQLSGKSVDVLGTELYKYLFNRRFLIVMDDMWSIDAWDEIQHFFPDNENSSRVLVTTRLAQLSSHLTNDYSLYMSFLDESSSWDLFSKTVFGENSCPRELKKIGKKIVDSCRGLPLSITVVGGLLKKMGRNQGSWESIRENLSSVVNMENEKHCLRLMRLSYNYLPVYLKPCFLYMGVFEEDDEILVSTLVKLWVSEGFLKPTNGESLETTARGFLQDLIDRNLILIGKLGSTGSIKSCKIHNLVRDMCLKEGQKDMFYHVIRKSNLPPRGMNTQRRVVIPRNTSKKKVRDDLRSVSHARSIISKYSKVLLCPNMGLLRTLHAYNVRDFEDKTYADSLALLHVNLRLVTVKDGDMSSFLLSASRLWNLHTVIVSGEHKTLLADFWKMPQFRHIDFGKKDKLRLPNPPRDRGDGDVVIMENLHTLKGVRDFKCSKEVVKRIPNIKKLRVQYDDDKDDDKDEFCVGNIKYFCKLESLAVSSGYIIRKLTFPHSLKKLNLYTDCVFEWEDLLEKIGSLPLLEKLELCRVFFGDGMWETVEGQFPRLRYLKLDECSSLEQWTAAEEWPNIFPFLEDLCLYELENLEMIPCELGSIGTLRRIQLIDCGEGAVRSAKEMVDGQVELQGEEEIEFQVEVYLRGRNEHLQSLAGHILKFKG